MLSETAWRALEGTIAKIKTLRDMGSLPTLNFIMLVSVLYWIMSLRYGVIKYIKDVYRFIIKLLGIFWGQLVCPYPSYFRRCGFGT